MDDKPNSQLHFIVRSQLVENNPEQVQKDLLQAFGAIEPLKPYIALESQKNHMDRLAKELEYFRQQDLATSKTVLNGKPRPAFMTKCRSGFVVPKRSGWNIKHALNVTKKNTGVIDINISVPTDVDSAVIVKI